MKTKLISLLVLIFSFACGTKYEKIGINPITPTKTSCIDIEDLDPYTGSNSNITLDIALEDTNFYGSFVTINAMLDLGGALYCCGSTSGGHLVLNNGTYQGLNFLDSDDGALYNIQLFCVGITPNAIANISLTLAPANLYDPFIYLTGNKRLLGFISINNQYIWLN